MKLSILVMVLAVSLVVLLFAMRNPTAHANPVSKPGDKVKVSVYNAQGKLVGPVEVLKVVKSDEEWQLQLPPDVYKIARNKGTEAPFCGTLLDNKMKGTYACIGCKLPLFSSNAKFESGTGWPSSFQPVAKENVATIEDRSYGMVRTEILCARCDTHLGHVFDDGPRPTGLRFCLNSASLSFVKEEELSKLADPAAASAPTTKPADAR